MKVAISVLPLLVVSFLASRQAQGACGATTFQPNSKFVPAGTTHNAYFLTDPVGEQRAVFDLVWGGALASLKQGGVERVWGHATGGMTFVPNPSAPPSYYLKLENTITNIHPTSNLPFGFELAGYAPYAFSNAVRHPISCAEIANNCYNSSTPDLLGGLYPDSTLTGGTAFFVSPQASWDPNQRTFVQLKTDDVNKNQSAHLFTENWVVAPGSSRKITWYVLVGSWSNALNFASLN